MYCICFLLELLVMPACLSDRWLILFGVIQKIETNQPELEANQAKKHHRCITNNDFLTRLDDHHPPRMYYVKTRRAGSSRKAKECFDCESNTGPQDLQSCALPTELSKHIFQTTKTIYNHEEFLSVCTQVYFL